MERKSTAKVNPKAIAPADLIKQKLHEDISENEQRYRDLVEHLPLCIAVISDDQIKFINNSGARMLGAKCPEEVVGKNVIEFVTPGRQQDFKKKIKEVLGGGSITSTEEKLVRLDTKIIEVEISSYPFTYHHKPAVQLIVKDITEQKETQAAARKSETLFYQLFHVSPLAIVMLDSEGNVAQINPGFEKMFGYSFKELKGKGLNETIVPSVLKSEGNDLNSLISSEQVVRIETKRQRKDGHMLSVIIYGLPVHFQDETIGIFGIYVDITEQKKIEEELKVRNTELDNFVYKVSHDLRAPLSSVLGLVNLAQIPGNDDNPIDYLHVIGQKVAQLDHFITDVLSHSKNLKLDIKIEEIPFRELINQTFTDLSYLKGAEEIIRSVTIEGIPFYSDRWRVGEILRNLISNAIKYRNFNREDSEIKIQIRTNEEETLITFSDNGIGIDAPNLDKIFNMFYRASVQSDGSGLGLYIVKNAIEKLGGHVEVKSIYTQGTTFIINLPNCAPAPEN